MFQRKIAKVAVILMTLLTMSALNSTPLFKETAHAQTSPSIAPLADQWWKWFVSLDTKALAQQYHLPDSPKQPRANPLFDTTGILCGVGLQNGMLFLVGTGGVTTAPGSILQQDTTYVRTCSTPIRQGTPILIPLVNTECSTLHTATTPSEFGWDDWCGTTSGQLRTQANLVINHAGELNIAVDGVPLTPQRAQSPGNGQYITWVPNNPFALFGPPYNVQAPTTVLSVADGYWALVNNLPLGQHQIKFGGAICSDSMCGKKLFETEVTYYLTVV
jgi:hypothetical protein